MIFAIDLDGTIVDDHRPYDDVTTPLQFLPGALEGLLALKRANHKLLLYSARANRALRIDPEFDPLVKAGAKHVHRPAWEKAQPLHEARYQQMLAFVALELPGVFDAIDSGEQGKPDADVFLDDRALRVGARGASGLGWEIVARIYGETVHDMEAERERRKKE